MGNREWPESVNGREAVMSDEDTDYGLKDYGVRERISSKCEVLRSMSEVQGPRSMAEKQ